MAAPNLANASNIFARQTAVGLNTTAYVGILTNTDSSGKVLRIDNIRITNVQGSFATNVTVGWSTVGSALIVADKDSGLYLEENYHLVAKAENAEYLEVLIKYEELSS
jgi:S1-C subfamily serine protease